MFKYVFIAPVAEEVVEAVYIAAVRRRNVTWGLCASTGQVCPTPYTGLTDEQFYLLRRMLGLMYDTNVLFERDHLGKNEDLVTIGEFIQRDTMFGVNLVMLHSNQLVSVHDWPVKLIHTLPDVRWQLGVGEGPCDGPLDDCVIDTAMSCKEAMWFSFPAGPRVGCLQNSNILDYAVISKVKRIQAINPRKGTLLRAHNCDYMSDCALREVKQHFDGFNVAPQAGTIMTVALIDWAMRHGYGHDLMVWTEACVHDEKRCGQWNVTRPGEALLMLGHYHYDRVTWRHAAREYVIKRLVKWLLHVSSPV